MAVRLNITALTDDRAELIAHQATADDRGAAHLIRDLYLTRGLRVAIWQEGHPAAAVERYQPTADRIDSIGRALRTKANECRAAAKRTRATGSAAQ